MMTRALIFFIALFTLTLQSQADDSVPSKVFHQGGVDFRLEKVSDGYDTPWSMAFLGGGKALVTERAKGTIHLIDLSDPSVKQPITGLPEMLRDADISAGLYDILYEAETGYLYMAHIIGTKDALGSAISRAKLQGTRLVDLTTLYVTPTRMRGKWHFGGRMVILGDFIYLTSGDGYDHRDKAQDLSHHAGKILRILKNGVIPLKNPFVSKPNALKEIYAIGSRNAQGMTLHPETKQIWFHEHGPQGGDEVNLLTYGANYGWPVITYGEEYGGGKIGEGTEKKGMTQPRHYWVPSIAPSGMSFYSGKKIPAWRGRLFIGALAKQHLNMLTLKGKKIIKEERLLTDQGWRVRFIYEGPDGYLYFATDTGFVARIVPAS